MVILLNEFKKIGGEISTLREKKLTTKIYIITKILLYLGRR